ncbi:MAG: ABC transporter permease [Bacteroidetes bacterium]|nr:MAG: ABC transporter permease [Bacteroidota bacterium]
MKRWFGFVRKEFYHILRDRRTMFILIGMPLVQILLFGFAVTNEIREARIGILDLSRDEHTQEIRNKLMASGYFRQVADWQRPEQVEAGFKSGDVKVVLIFEEDFGQNLKREGLAHVQIITDATDPNTGQTLLSYVSTIIIDYQRELNQPYQLPLRIEVETQMRYNPELKGVFLFVPGLITIILMLVSALMTSVSIAREKEMGTMEVLLASPMRPIQIILGKVAPYVLLGLLIALGVLLIGYFVFDVPVKGNLLLLAAEGLLFVITVLSLGVLISIVSPNQQVALMVSMMVLMMPTILLSGFMFPIENMPPFLQYISLIIPARWFIVIIKNIMLKGSGIEQIWQETLILFGFTVFYIVLAIRRFKVRLA